MDLSLLKIAEKTAPRYTSYPTAPMFSAEVTSETYGKWLGELNADATLSLYLHIPYCKSICLYCGCHTFATRKEAPVLDYADTLIKEIQLVAAKTKARKVKSIAWGGGTPNILSPATFLKITDAIKSHFDLSQINEHAVEMDPRLLNDEHIAAFVKAGVNRASLGVQDMNHHVQKAIGRVQDLSLVKRATKKLRAAGIDAVNMDLIYGLPEQSLEDAINSAKIAASLKPSRLAVFGYAHVPWFKKRQRLINEAALPETALRYDQAMGIKAALEALGYVAIGFDHFARSDDPLAIAALNKTVKRSFQGYSCETADAIIGLGCSSISTLPQGYVQNNPEPGAWARAIEAGEFATVRGVATSAEDKTRREIIDRLLGDFEVDLAEFGGVGSFFTEIRNLAAEEGDLVKITDEIVKVTEFGKPFVRLVARHFDAYLDGSNAKHSRVI
ncbi:MAG: oxygen-independent coproporphyrinogen III oxidase [Hyphomonadaceae bacterium]|nr:MAG: oxygen-independent coproporphyrinogen III oxidase [Hyphomonadaceae bacterium]